MNVSNVSPREAAYADANRPWAAITANPYSGARANRKYVEQLAAALSERRIETRIVWDAAERAGLLRSPEIAGCRCIVVMGGDGTVADVINERPPVPLATLPLGTENLFAREFGFTRDVHRLAEAITRGRERTIDLGCANGRYFSLMLSAGFDAEVVRRVAAWRQAEQRLRRLTHLSYARHILAATRAYAWPIVRLEADGETVEGAHVIVQNLPQYGMRLRFAPDAGADDGLLDWVVFQGSGFAATLNYARDVRRGRHRDRADVRCGRAQRLRLTAPEPVPLQMDGDAAGTTPVNVEIVPEALRVIIP